jgi:hypothetical protein
VDNAQRLAVDAALVVGVVQPGGGTGDHRQRHLDRDLALERRHPLQHVAHVLAVHVLHREEVAVADPTDVVDLRDVRMVELRGEAGLVEEHRHETMVARVLGHDPLEHHVALEARDADGAREVQLRHPARRQMSEDLVLVGRGTGVALACAIHCENRIRGVGGNVKADRATAAG